MLSWVKYISFASGHARMVFSFLFLRSLMFGSSLTSSHPAKKKLLGCIAARDHDPSRSRRVSTFPTGFLQAPFVLDRYLLGHRCQSPFGLQFYFVLGVSLLGDSDPGGDSWN